MTDGPQSLPYTDPKGDAKWRLENPDFLAGLEELSESIQKAIKVTDKTPAKKALGNK